MEVTPGCKVLLPLLVTSLTILLVKGETCGPIGYKATDLLKPAYWYFDLNRTECDKLPKPKSFDIIVPGNNSQHACRFYMHICKGMTYQCSGTVCLRYLHTEDYVSLLGSEISNPFNEGHKTFESTFIGESSLCKDSNAYVQTNIKFVCDLKANWNTSIVHHHGGALSPNPVVFSFDKAACRLNVQFNYSGACEKFENGSTPGKSISIGSIILILFFPGLALYFIMGMLINRMAGHHGKELIPHASFWLSLPDLIMDGFVFTMQTITCRKEDRTSYETM
ncbi:uncharacterized protein LOC135687408 [Rhopilema esculentum]|uniref:uncharacterized protein LOC135687408 n=1 Tax=Rhopilema esculentum TaxID=499914 RepID=UPI0031E23DEC